MKVTDAYLLHTQDFWNPNSVNKDPLFPNNKIADHEVGYPGLQLFVVRACRNDCHVVLIVNDECHGHICPS